MDNPSIHPEVHHESGTFTLASAAGNERKATGSYYTPTSLISALLDSALDPVLDEAAAEPDAGAAILDLKVLDPACGSGHFLVAAAHRIAKRLAAHRTDEPEPSPGAYRAALREVISRCIFGIDVNSMATELCKVSLWMESVEPGKPLSFLEHHIVCGNSLLGTTPALLSQGIPDEAFTFLEGDDKETVKSLKKRNKEERKGQTSLFGAAAHPDLLTPIATQVAALEATPDDSPQALHAKQQAWEMLEASDQVAHAKHIADAWCAAFVIEKSSGSPVLTQGVFELLRRRPEGGDPKLRTAIDELVDRYRFLHPHLAFPQVFHTPGPEEEPDNPDQGWTGGFDLVVGNPPWGRVKLNEKQWFAARHPAVAEAVGARRKAAIALLEMEDPHLFGEFQEASRRSEAESTFLRSSGRYPLCGRGDVNTYAAFAELATSVLDARGASGLVVPSGIATDSTTQHYWKFIAESGRLRSLFDFVNEANLFPGVGHGRQKFCLLTVGGSAGGSTLADLAFFLVQPSELHQQERHFTLAPEDLRLLNPNTGTCPVFRTLEDAELTRAIYRRVPILLREEPVENPWALTFMRMFDMTNDSGGFRRTQDFDGSEIRSSGNIVIETTGHRWLPLYEGKMFHHFNHRFGDYSMRPEGSLDSELPEVPDGLLADPSYEPMPLYWVAEEEVAERLGSFGDRGWAIAFRDVTNSNSERTFVCSALPGVGVGNNAPLLFVGDAQRRLGGVLLANLTSIAFDYVSRQKINAAHANFFIVKQLPVLPPASGTNATPWDSSVMLAEWLTPRVLELTYTSHSLVGFARDLGYEGPPFTWQPDRRAVLRAELDAAFCHLYGLTRADVARVLDTFPLVRRADERQHGEYRTGRLISERYEAMAHAMAGNASYASSVDPPAGDPGRISSGG